MATGPVFRHVRDPALSGCVGSDVQNTTLSGPEEGAAGTSAVAVSTRLVTVPRLLVFADLCCRV